MRLIAFLRAINVGGHTVTNDRLRALFEALGLKNVETFIASGNVIFAAPSRDVGGLPKRIERHLAKSLGYEVHTFIRTDTELAGILRDHPFTPDRLATCALHVAFLAEPLADDGRKLVKAFETDVDAFHVNGRELYWLCRVSQGESTFSNVRFEKVLKVRTTIRGINTVARIAAKYPPASEDGLRRVRPPAEKKPR